MQPDPDISVAVFDCRKLKRWRAGWAFCCILTLLSATSSLCCRNPTDGELVQSNSRYLNSGAPSFCKGQATNRYSFIPKSESPGPIYDTCKSLGMLPSSDSCFGMCIMACSVSFRTDSGSLGASSLGMLYSMLCMPGVCMCVMVCYQ